MDLVPSLFPFVAAALLSLTHSLKNIHSLTNRNNTFSLIN